jgi:hypothetical protein
MLTVVVIVTIKLRLGISRSKLIRFQREIENNIIQIATLRSIQAWSSRQTVRESPLYLCIHARAAQDRKVTTARASTRGVNTPAMRSA